MKKILFLLFLAPLFLNAQENTFGPKNETKKMLNDTLVPKGTSALIITFEPRLYMSQIDKQLATRNNLSFDQLVDKMRFDLAESVAFRIGDKMTAQSLFQPRSDSLMKELHYTYTSVQYAYRPLIAEDAIQNDPEKKEKIRIPVGIKSRENKTGNLRTDPGTRIENGQIVSEEDSREKFMDCEIMNPELFNELHTLFHCDYFIFLNQLDLLYSPESVEFIRIKVHYTCYSRTGKKIHSGASTKNMPADITDLKIIRNDYFYPVAIEISEKLGLAIKAHLVQPRD